MSVVAWARAHPKTLVASFDNLQRERLAGGGGGGNRRHRKLLATARGEISQLNCHFGRHVPGRRRIQGLGSLLLDPQATRQRFNGFMGRAGIQPRTQVTDLGDRRSFYSIDSSIHHQAAADACPHGDVQHTSPAPSGSPSGFGQGRNDCSRCQSRPEPGRFLQTIAPEGNHSSRGLDGS